MLMMPEILNDAALQMQLELCSRYISLWTQTLLHYPDHKSAVSYVEYYAKHAERVRAEIDRRNNGTGT